MHRTLALVLLVGCKAQGDTPPDAAEQEGAAALEDARARQDLDTAQNEAQMVQQLAEQYMLVKRGACPANPQALRDAGFATRMFRDPWGGEYTIACEAGHVKTIAVRSAGPDGKFDTETTWSAIRSIV